MKRGRDHVRKYLKVLSACALLSFYLQFFYTDILEKSKFLGGSFIPVHELRYFEKKFYVSKKFGMQIILNKKKSYHFLKIHILAEET